MVKVPARPRVPVAVRRATPDSARLRAKYGMPPLPEPDLLDQVELREEVPLPLPMPSPMQWTREPAPDHAPSPDATEVQQSVGAMTRLAAVAIDATLLLGIAGAVLYLTLQLTGHDKDLGGGFVVRRLLPSAARQSVGPDLFFDQAERQRVGAAQRPAVRLAGAQPDPHRAPQGGSVVAQPPQHVQLRSALVLGEPHPHVLNRRTERRQQR